MGFFSNYELGISYDFNETRDIDDEYYQQYLNLHREEMTDEDLKEMYDEYYSCYEVYSYD